MQCASLLAATPNGTPKQAEQLALLLLLADRHAVKAALSGFI